MAQIGRLTISPPLINTSCAWAGEKHELQALFDSPFTGAITTRTATTDGFKEDATHTVVFSSTSVSSLNSYGYSPHPLTTYLAWIRELITTSPASTKPFVISITSSSPARLALMLGAIQDLRTALGDTRSAAARIAVELNTSCPNIKDTPPPAYAPATLRALLVPLADAHKQDPTLTLGLKLPPYVHAGQFADLVDVVASFSGDGVNPFAFFTCTNTLGSALLFTEQTTDAHADAAAGAFALPTPLGGLAGEALHALALGNVYTFATLLADHEDAALRAIAIIGVGGVTSPAAVGRMRASGARVVGCATLLGREGVAAFEILSKAA